MIEALMYGPAAREEVEQVQQLVVLQERLQLRLVHAG